MYRYVSVCNNGVSVNEAMHTYKYSCSALAQYFVLVSRCNKLSVKRTHNNWLTRLFIAQIHGEKRNGLRIKSIKTFQQLKFISCFVACLLN